MRMQALRSTILDMAKRTGAPSGSPLKSDADRHFTTVVRTFAKDRRVRREAGKGFGSGALKVNGKIFAMITSKGYFVVKLPRARVDHFVAAGVGERFDP